MTSKSSFSLFSFKSLYVLFFIAVVFYGQVRLMFGLTPRHIAIIVMLMVCIKEDNGLIPMGRIMKAYFVFILAFIGSALVTGFISQLLITYYIAACVGYWATKILIKKYNHGKLLLKIIISIGILNAIITIGQTLNIPYADQFVSFVHLKLPVKYLEKMNENGSGNMAALMFTRPGLFNSSVYNGYFLLTAGIASLQLLVYRFRPLRLVPWIINTIGCFCVQERSPIIILVVLSAFAFYKILFYKKRHYILLLIGFFLIMAYIARFFAYVLPERMEEDSLQTNTITRYEDDDEPSSGLISYTEIVKDSRFGELGLDDTGRGDIYQITIGYLMDHPIVGGYHRLVRIHEIAPHNLFLNAFIYGGFIGGVAILFILFWQIKPLWRVFIRKVAATNPVCFFLGLAYVAFTLNSFLHNRSIVTGDELLWMMWAGFYYEYRKYFTTPKL